MLSIIIPTLNEENYLSDLLCSIKSQGFSDYEIIVSDAGSSDKTLEIAKKYGCKFIPGGLPAKGKNEGAKMAKGDLLLFLDADTILQQDFLKENIAEFRKRNLDIGGVQVAFIGEKKIADWLLNFFYNFPIILLEKMLAHVAIAIFINKNTFDKINGFDESIALAEDHDMGRRAAKFGKYGVLRAKKILTSDRRFEKDGWLRTYAKYVFTEFYMIFKGPVKKGVVKYDFDGYPKQKK